jgi:hypothetical protein
MINLKIRGMEELKAKLDSVPYGARGDATESMAKALIGNQQTGLQHYPRRKAHGAGNPYEWQSERQRKAYFATDGFGGGIPYRRTDNLKFGWHVNKWDGTKTTVMNDVAYTKFVQGDSMQKGHSADGWRNIQAVIASNLQAMMHAADQAVARLLKRKGLT